MTFRAGKDAQFIVYMPSVIHSVESEGADADTWTSYLAKHKATNSITISIVGGILIYLADDAVSGDAEKTKNASARLFSNGAAASILALSNAQVTPVGSANHVNVEGSKANKTNALVYLMNLVNAAKKAPLTPKTASSFFEMIDIPNTQGGSISKLINDISPFYIDGIFDADFRDELHKCVWTDYRNTRVSTGIVIQKEIQVFIDLGIVSDAEKATIKASDAAPWDLSLANDIPPKLKAYASIYLETAGRPLDGWWQGNAARDVLTAAKFKNAKKIFSKYLSLKDDAGDIADLNTVAELAAVTKDFW